ncbi:NADPH:quinone reductase [Virgisporangium aliadipatigenens]|uniref:NADPH:quinone reductase n=1 Tax=Virgisporangium aliadipatigenens TaxID=741659 RepID=A0A8J4DTM7_9ACTN|nr:zinc-binding dehydrogenase [Virgisporangium aliadipatigenens]GIJ49168.1 NADPH:quinone reductase [Virgisporangium aliadipatigenens]
METMRAAVVDRPGPPEVLVVRDVPRPTATADRALVRVRAAGLNRSEIMTRQGHSPNVRFPRVLGIECVGEVVEAAETGPPVGTTVAAVMGEMGRAYDGGYAEFALLPAARLMPLSVELDWSTLGALPETFLTAHGSLGVLGLAPGQRLVIRAATSSVGMAALSLAVAAGLDVAATTRNPGKAAALEQHGAAHVLVDSGDFAGEVRRLWPDGADGVLDLVGGPSLRDAFAATARGGIVCNSGLLGGSWVIPDFEPLAHMPTGVKLAVFDSASLEPAVAALALQGIAEDVAAGRYSAHLHKTFPLEEIAEAHAYMEANRATGKVVVIP